MGKQEILYCARTDVHLSRTEPDLKVTFHKEAGSVVLVVVLDPGRGWGVYTVYPA